MIKLFGITNCDTVRKARKWLDENHIEVEFINFRKPDFTSEHIQSWLKIASFEDIVNKRSQAWKALSTAQQIELIKTQNLESLIKTPTLIKRPLLQTSTNIIFGFKESDYQDIV